MYLCDPVFQYHYKIVLVVHYDVMACTCTCFKVYTLWVNMQVGGVRHAFLSIQILNDGYVYVLVSRPLILLNENPHGILNYEMYMYIVMYSKGHVYSFILFFLFFLHV